jgi:hypothetical protein
MRKSLPLGLFLCYASVMRRRPDSYLVLLETGASSDLICFASSSLTLWMHLPGVFCTCSISPSSSMQRDLGLGMDAQQLWEAQAENYQQACGRGQGGVSAGGHTG